ncbi:AsnC family protein [Streptomyces fractus]|uniref:AsnC family protein n=1 Tax=Streptomyces fractus TaxID=641806 RepID=UPI003CED72DB
MLRPEYPKSTAAESPVPDEPIRPIDRRIAHALGTDGRMPLSGLAQATGASTATVRRRVFNSWRVRLGILGVPGFVSHSENRTEVRCVTCASGTSGVEGCRRGGRS